MEFLVCESKTQTFIKELPLEYEDLNFPRNRRRTEMVKVLVFDEGVYFIDARTGTIIAKFKLLPIR